MPTLVSYVNLHSLHSPQFPKRGQRRGSHPEWHSPKGAARCLPAGDGQNQPRRHRPPASSPRSPWQNTTTKKHRHDGWRAVRRTLVRQRHRPDVGDWSGPASDRSCLRRQHNIGKGWTPPRTVPASSRPAKAILSGSMTGRQMRLLRPVKGSETSQSARGCNKGFRDPQRQGFSGGVRFANCWKDLTPFPGYPRL